MPNKALVKFVKEARRRGFDDFQIKEPLLERGWPSEEIDKAFATLSPKYKFKNKISVYLDSNLLKILEKRAKKNLLTLPEQIEDIIRRSCINSKGITREKEKLDDLLIGLFSRRRKSKKI